MEIALGYKDKKKRDEYNKQWQKDNPEKVSEYQKQYRKDNLEKVRGYEKQWRQNNPKHKKIFDLRKKYNLSYEGWLQMWEVQDGKCAICGNSFTKPSDAQVDHDHRTGKIRGLLCHKCNSGMGYFNDNPQIIIKVIKYLKI